MSRADKMLDAMRDNPRDWRIEDVIAICQRYGIKITPPRSGSHYKVRNPVSGAILPVPAARPIKPVYIRELVAIIDQVRVQAERVP